MTNPPTRARRRRTLPAVLIALAAGVTATRAQEPGAPPAVPSVRIINPERDAVLKGRNVPVVLDVRGIVVARVSERRPGTAHVDLFLDRDVPAVDSTMPPTGTGIVHLGRGQTWHTYEQLNPGPHRLVAVLVDWTHVPLAPLAADTVRFTIKPRR